MSAFEDAAREDRRRLARRLLDRCMPGGATWRHYMALVEKYAPPPIARPLLGWGSRFPRPRRVWVP